MDSMRNGQLEEQIAKQASQSTLQQKRFESTKMELDERTQALDERERTTIKRQQDVSYLVRLRGQKGIGKARGPDGRVRGLTQAKNVGVRYM